MKFLKSRFFMVAVLLMVGLIILTTVLGAIGLPAPLRSALKTISTPFVWCGNLFGEAVDGFVGAFTRYDELKAENEALRETVASMESKSRENEVLKSENAWLKTYLKMATEHPEFSLTDARVIAREVGSAVTVLTLDRGRVHGVKNQMSVITESGLLGYVKETGLDWCKVVTVVETASSVGVYTDRTGVEGVAEGNASLSGSGVCHMTYIERGSDIRNGDCVYTKGGEGSLYPPGLLLGTVVSLDLDESAGMLIATVEPAVDFSDPMALSRVMIVSGYATEG